MGDDIYKTVGGYVTGNILISLIAGASMTIVLLVMGVPYAVALGLLVAFLDLIPLAGATVAGIVVTIVAFLHSVPAGIVVVVFVIVYQQIENHFLQPVIYGRTVQLSPLVVLVSVLVGAELAGILGALAAIPGRRGDPGDRARPARAPPRASRVAGTDPTRAGLVAAPRLSPEPALRSRHAPVAQWKSGGLLSRWSEVRILPGAPPPASAGSSPAPVLRAPGPAAPSAERNRALTEAGLPVPERHRHLAERTA